MVALFIRYTMEEEFDPYGLPPEFTHSPLSHIGIVGLDIVNNATHKSVWETFAVNRRADRSPLQFKLLPLDFQLPPMKQKRQSYEWYIPKGILKTNWVNKYMQQIPALIVLFYDLDWNDPNWNDKKNELASQIQTIKRYVDCYTNDCLTISFCGMETDHITRTILGGRNCRIALVLIQSGVYLPGEDAGATEKAATLCSACDIIAKHLFVLPHSDAHLLGYTVRLENALSEIAGGFYAGEARIVRGHRDYLNKTNHQLLFVRHQFKLGFLNEMRNDPQTAIKHYIQSYHHCLELRSSDTNLHEIRVAAAILNYKICRLDFALNLPRDAIAQFKGHIDLFRQRTGPKELIFEHYAWLSKQYQIFGDVFEEAVRQGLPAVQTQHPGFYYQQAALYASLRRKTAQQVCKDIGVPQMDVLDGWKDLEFYGQRPWRPAKHTLEPPDPQREVEGIKALQYNEINVVNHCNLIIPLFSSAISQFKKYRCPRIKRHLMVQMAEEYHTALDHAKALTLLSHVMWDYRNEKWWSLLSYTSNIALRCAYVTTSVTEYIGLALEAVGPRIILPPEEKQQVHTNLTAIIRGEAPSMETHANVETDQIKENWTRTLQSYGSMSSPITIDMTTLVPCIEVRATFNKTHSFVDEKVEILIRIRNTYCEPMQLSSLSVTLNIPAYNEQLIESDQSKLLLKNDKVNELNLTFKPHVEDIEKRVKITGITAQLQSSEAGPVVVLQWTGPGNEGVTACTANTPVYTELSLLGPDVFEVMVPKAETEITPRKPKLTVTVEHDPITLVWEWLPVKIVLSNEKEHDVCSNVSISLTLVSGTDTSLEQTTFMSTAASLQGDKQGSSISEHPMEDIAVGACQSVVLYVKSLTAVKRTLLLKVKYDMSFETAGTSLAYPTVCEEKIDINTEIPFQISVETMSLKCERVSRVADGESFLVVPRITSIAHQPLVFTDSSLSLNEGAALVGMEVISQIAGTELIKGEIGVDCFCVAVNPKQAANNVNLNLGQYVLHWKRANSETPAVSVSVGLPSVTLESYGIAVELKIPPNGYVRTPMNIAYIITNKATHTAELALNMQTSDGFMFAGPKELRLRVLPGGSECITYILYPLLAGNVQLPKLSLIVESHSPGQLPSLEPLLNRVLPTHVYIIPQAKGKSTSSEENAAVPVSAVS